MPTTLDRDRLLTIMRHKNHGMAQILHMIALLKEAASLVSDYPAFQSVCAESLLQAWHSDRLSGKRELPPGVRIVVAPIGNTTRGYI